MPVITAETADGIVSLNVESGRRLVLEIEDGGVDILHRCGGNARCTTCRVEVIAGDPGEIRDAERDILATKQDLGDHTRLSCQVLVNDDLHVRVINQSRTTGLDPGPRPEETLPA